MDLEDVRRENFDKCYFLILLVMIFLLVIFKDKTLAIITFLYMFVVPGLYNISSSIKDTLNHKKLSR